MDNMVLKFKKNHEICTNNQIPELRKIFIKKLPYTTDTCSLFIYTIKNKFENFYHILKHWCMYIERISAIKPMLDIFFYNLNPFLFPIFNYRNSIGSSPPQRHIQKPKFENPNRVRSHCPNTSEYTTNARVCTTAYKLHQCACVHRCT